jgi:hypothetical protein
MLEPNGARFWETLMAPAASGQIAETGLRRLILTEQDRPMCDLFAPGRPSSPVVRLEHRTRQ